MPKTEIQLLSDALLSSCFDSGLSTGDVLTALMAVVESYGDNGQGDVENGGSADDHA